MENLTVNNTLIVTTISSNYKWEEIRNWFFSLKETDYHGEILVLAYNYGSEATHPHLTALKEFGARVIIPTHDYNGNPETNWIWHSGQVTKQNAHKLIHNVRLFHLWQYLSEHKHKYDYIIFTDSRDVYFQRNPVDFLLETDDNNSESYKPYDILVPSEGVLYRDQPWNNQNMMVNYGMYAAHYMRDNVVANVGTFACRGHIALDLLFTMFMMCKDTGHADQPSFNILTSGLLKDKCKVVDYRNPWALQIGAIANEGIYRYCTIMVTNGEDYKFLQDEQYSGSLYHLYPKNETDQTEYIPFAIVHQYDRIPELKKAIDDYMRFIAEKRGYGDNGIRIGKEAATFANLV